MTSHDTVTLRPYAPRDLDAALAVWERATAVGHPFLGAAFLVDEREAMAGWLPAAETTVAVDREGTVVGFSSLVGDEVGGLFVDPARHRTGVGRALLAAAQARHDSLTLGVFEANTGARAFYERHGFVVTGPSDELVDGHRELRMAWRAR